MSQDLKSPYNYCFIYKSQRFLTLLTLLPSSCSSSLMELDGEGVADLLAGGDGEVWVILGPAMFRFSCPLSWDWLIVVS